MMTAPTLRDVKNRFQLTMYLQPLSSSDRDVEQCFPGTITYRTWVIYSKTMKGKFQTYTNGGEEAVFKRYLDYCEENPDIRPPFGKRMLKMVQEVFSASRS